MAKIIATTFGIALGLLSLAAFASPGLFGAHTTSLVNVLHLLLAAGMVWITQKAGPAAFFGGCVGVAACLLVWGLAGFIFGRPGESTLAGQPPDLKLLVLIPGWIESGRNDHVLRLFFGVAFGVAAVAAAAETPFRLRK